MDEDQRFASERPDVLVYETAPLTSDMTIAGPIAVDFVVSTSGTDSDWIIKLIDVFPGTLKSSGTRVSSGPRSWARPLGGYEMLVRGDVLRGKFRESMSAPKPFVPTPIGFTLNDAFHTFRAGHRIMVQGAEHLVPDDRPEPRQVHEHLPSEGRGFSSHDAARIPLGGSRVPRGPRRDAVSKR